MMTDRLRLNFVQQQTTLDEKKGIDYVDGYVCTVGNCVIIVIYANMSDLYGKRIFLIYLAGSIFLYR